MTLFDAVPLRCGQELPNRVALALGADVVSLGRSAILNPDWPRTVARGEPPTLPPMTRADLGKRAVSPVFQQYVTAWKNFVAD